MRIAKMVRLVICSFRTSQESKGTKIYPNDSRSASSFNCNPRLNAQMFTTNTIKKMAYEDRTNGLSISKMPER